MKKNKKDRTKSSVGCHYLRVRREFTAPLSPMSPAAAEVEWRVFVNEKIRRKSDALNAQNTACLSRQYSRT